MAAGLQVKISPERHQMPQAIIRGLVRIGHGRECPEFARWKKQGDRSRAGRPGLNVLAAVAINGKTLSLPDDFRHAAVVAGAHANQGNLVARLYVPLVITIVLFGGTDGMSACATLVET